MRRRSTRLVSPSVDALRQLDEWGADNAAAGVVGPEGVRAVHGPVGHEFRWASVTKPATALATLVAAEEGVVDLDEPAGPPGSTVRHLLAHASGLPFEGEAPIAEPGQATDLLEHRLRAAGSARGSGRRDAVRRLPAGGGLRAARHGRRAPRLGRARTCSARSTTRSSWRASCCGRRWSRPRRSPRRRRVQFPGLRRRAPRPRALGPERLGPRLRAARTGRARTGRGRRNSPRTFGHFGGSGTFLWVDPDVDLALRRPERPRVRRLGAGGVAAPLGFGARHGLRR